MQIMRELRDLTDHDHILMITSVITVTALLPFPHSPLPTTVVTTMLLLLLWLFLGGGRDRYSLLSSVRGRSLEGACDAS